MRTREVLFSRRRLIAASPDAGYHLGHPAPRSLAASVAFGDSVGVEDVAFLRNLDVDMKALKIFRDYCQRNLKDRQRLLAWQLERQVEYNVDTILAYMTAHKFMRYLDEQYAFLQFRLTQYQALRYRSMQDVVTEYRDYLNMCKKQNYDMTNSFVLYPRDLQKAHDKLAHRIRMKADAKVRRAFRTAYQRIMGQLDFEFNGMKIVYPATPDDIVAEGNALHHCVGTYVGKVAQQKTMILFLRRCEDITKPFYTVAAGQHPTGAGLNRNGEKLPR